MENGQKNWVGSIKSTLVELGKNLSTQDIV